MSAARLGNASLVVIFAALAAFIEPSPTARGAESPADSTATNNTATNNPTNSTANNSTATSDAAAKQQIFASPAWQQAMAGLNAWFSVQVVYPQREIPKLKQELVARWNEMSAAELRDYLADLQQKLKILESPEAIAMRSYIASTLSVASDAYAAKIRSQLPDVLNMNALQVKQALYNMQQQQAATQATQAAFDAQRAAQVRLVRQWTQQTADANAAAAAQMNSYPAGGGYLPPVRNPMPVYNPAPIIVGWPW